MVSEAAPRVLADYTHSTAVTTASRDDEQALYVSSSIKRRRTFAELNEIDEVIVQVVAAEHPVTLRGVFYRVMSLGAIEKTEAGYRVIGRQLVKLRRAGRVPYHWISDGTRYTLRPDTWDDAEQALTGTAQGYRKSLWRNQDAEVIILSEKDAITGAISPVTNDLDVELAIARGYSSETFAYSVASTLAGNTRAGKTTFVYQLGDHDPSGLDAWRDFQRKVHRFAPGVDVQMSRLAVTPEQIIEYGLPTRPTKTSDSRAGKFRGESVEVDAIEAPELRRLVRRAIEQHLNTVVLQETKSIERAERSWLLTLAGGAQ